MYILLSARDIHSHVSEHIMSARALHRLPLAACRENVEETRNPRPTAKKTLHDTLISHKRTRILLF